MTQVSFQEVDYDHVKRLARKLHGRSCHFLDAHDRKTITNIRQFAVLVKGRTAHLCPIPRTGGMLMPLEKRNNGNLEMSKRTVGGEIMDGRAPGTTIAERVETYNWENTHTLGGVITHYVDMWDVGNSNEIVLTPVFHDK